MNRGPLTRCSQDVRELLLDDLQRCQESSRPFCLTVDRLVPTRSDVNLNAGDPADYVYQRHLSYDIELLEERAAGSELQMENASDVVGTDETDGVNSAQPYWIHSEKVLRQMC